MRKSFFMPDQKLAKATERSIENSLNITGWSIGQPVNLQTVLKNNFFNYKGDELPENMAELMKLENFKSITLFLLIFRSKFSHDN